VLVRNLQCFYSRKIGGFAMIRIAVCESDESFRNKLDGLLLDYFSVRNINYAIDFYENGDSLLKADLKKYHAFCLEIKKDSDGLDTAKILRMRGFRGDIVFITDQLELAYRAFEVNALRYILKPVDVDILYATMDLIVKRKQERQSQLIILNRGQSYLQIPYETIIYFETIDRKLCAHTTKKDYVVDNKITDLDLLLSDKNFFRVHKSYLVNLAYVQEYDQTTVTMLNGDIVYISRLKVKLFKEKFSKYLMNDNRLEYSIYSC